MNNFDHDILKEMLENACLVYNDTSFLVEILIKVQFSLLFSLYLYHLRHHSRRSQLQANSTQLYLSVHSDLAAQLHKIKDYVTMIKCESRETSLFYI